MEVSKIISLLYNLLTVVMLAVWLQYLKHFFNQMVTVTNNGLFYFQTIFTFYDPFQLFMIVL